MFLLQQKGDNKSLFVRLLLQKCNHAFFYTAVRFMYHVPNVREAIKVLATDAKQDAKLSEHVPHPCFSAFVYS